MTRYAALFTGEEAEAVDVPRSAAKRYRVLIVDDEPHVLNALRRVFRQENYEIMTAENGQEAIDLLTKTPCEVMISDYMMPIMNGAELLKRARAQYPDMIRIMLTGQADTSAVMAAIKDGTVFKFILKPWNDDDLRITVALALEQFDLKARNKKLAEQNTRSAVEIGKLAKLAITNRSQLALMLNKRGLLNPTQVQELHKLQQVRKEPLIKLLVEKGWVPEERIHKILRDELLMEEVDLAEYRVDPAIAALLPRSFCERQWVIPLQLEERRLRLAMADPLENGLIDELGFVTGLKIEPATASSKAILAKIESVYSNSEVSFADVETLVSSADPLDGIEIVIENEDDLSLDELLRATDEPPAIRLVNAILLEAVRHGASDIHIHPRTKSVVVRYRIDGVLFDKIQIPPSLFQALVSRIKVMAELDITERRRPQDGRITIKTPLKIVDVRLSTLPTLNGEKIVMRLLDRNSAIVRVEELGLPEAGLRKIVNVISKPQGIILTTGPTGSGKTTSLYSLLQHNATTEKNYVTIEDPVEYYLDMAGQVYVREKIGLDFPTVLRSILRQDPDVILLGEIRDLPTAEVAFHAALTGHQVFSTLHTNSAVATVARLLDLGLKPFVIASALEAIIAQRLVRRICPDCREEVTPPAEVQRRLGPRFATLARAFRGRGCEGCHKTGLRGRIGVYEVLVPDDEMRALIGSGASILELKTLTERQSLATLIDDARHKVELGLTNPEEVLRVLGSQIVE